MHLRPEMRDISQRMGNMSRGEHKGENGLSRARPPRLRITWHDVPHATRRVDSHVNLLTPLDSIGYRPGIRGAEFDFLRRNKCSGRARINVARHAVKDGVTWRERGIRVRRRRRGPPTSETRVACVERPQRAMDALRWWN